MMMTGCIKTLDLVQRQAVITTQEGKEVLVNFPEEANIEVAEPATMGTQRGELTDLREGYWVEIEVAEHNSEGDCCCTSLVCLS